MCLPDEVSTGEGDKFRAGVPALLEVRRLCIQECCREPCVNATPAHLDPKKSQKPRTCGNIGLRRCDVIFYYMRRAELICWLVVVNK